MFRAITRHVPLPSLLLLCDDHRCGQFFTVAIEDGADLVTVQARFVQTAMGQGWSVKMDRHLCPLCAQKERDEDHMVRVPSLVSLN